MDNSACPPAHKRVNIQPSYSVPHLSLRRLSYVPLVELQDASAKPELPLWKSLLRCQKRPWESEFGQQMLTLNVYASSVNGAQDWVINWE